MGLGSLVAEGVVVFEPGEAVLPLLLPLCPTCSGNHRRFETAQPRCGMVRLSIRSVAIDDDRWHARDQTRHERRSRRLRRDWFTLEAVRTTDQQANLRRIAEWVIQTAAIYATPQVPTAVLPTPSAFDRHQVLDSLIAAFTLCQVNIAGGQRSSPPCRSEARRYCPPLRGAGARAWALR